MSSLGLQQRLQGNAVTGTGVTTLSPIVPASAGINMGAKVGDLLVMAVVVAGTTAQTFTVPNGWTQQCNLNAQAPVLAVFTKKCTNSDIGAAQQITWTTAGDARAGIVTYSMPDWQNVFIDGTASASTASSTTINYGTFTPRSFTSAIAIAGYTNNSATPTGSGFGVNFVSGAAGAATGIAIGQVSSSGNTGTALSPTATVVNATTSQGFLLTVRSIQFSRVRLGATASGTAVSSLTPGTGGWQVGDLAVLSVHWASATVTLTDPSGWTLQESVVDTAQSMKVYTRTIQSGDAAPAISFSGSTDATAMVEPYYGVSGVRAHYSQIFPTGSNFAQAPSASAGQPGDTLVACWGGTTGGFTGGGATGMLEPNVSNVSSGTSGQCHAFEPITTPITATGGGAGIRSCSMTAGRNIGVTLILQRSVTEPLIGAFAFTTAATAAGLTVQMPPSANIANGDLLLMILRSKTGADSVTSPPTGWTLVASDTSATSPKVWVYKKVAASEPSTYSVTFSGAAIEHSAAVVTVLGAATVDVSATANTAGASVGSFSAAGVTAGFGNELLLILTGTGNTSANTPAPPTGTWAMGPGAGITQGTNGIGVAWEYLANAGATGTRTISTGGANVAFAEVTLTVIGVTQAQGLGGASATLTRPVAMQSLAKSNGKTTVVPAPTLKATRGLTSAPVGSAVVQGGAKVAYRPTGNADGLAVVSADTIAVRRALASAGIVGVGSVASSALNLTLQLSGASAGHAVAYATEWVIPVDWPVTHVPTLLVAGTIYDHLGAPVSGATVKLFRVRDDFMCQETTSAADGSYAFVRDNTDPNTYYVVAYAVAGVTQIHGTSDRDLIPV